MEVECQEILYIKSVSILYLLLIADKSTTHSTLFNVSYNSINVTDVLLHQINHINFN